jgi:EAL domain-containing protein (putative c-di-GMP-specific phosphodiesterase class I)
MSAAPPERLEIEKRLRSALDRKEMVLFYQPQINLAANRVCGAEALLRWRQEGFGIVSPAAFMPVLEETGLIVNFGRWALAEACRQGKEWIDEAGLAMRLGVNVSGLQFADPRFVDDVRTILHDTGFPPELLELELTESMLVEDDSTGMQSLRALANAGIQLALDDFGTGHSCLSYLHRLPFRRLKIDQSFVRIIARDEDCPPLLDDIIRMADNLGMTAIAEGIETPHQAGLLRSHGCEEGQGYYFAGPMPPDQFLSFCRQYSTAGSEFAPEPAAVAWHPRRS